MAIGIENGYTGYKNDDKIFKMVAKTAEVIDDVYVSTYYPMRKCIETDYEKFGKADERLDKKF